MKRIISLIFLSFIALSVSKVYAQETIAPKKGDFMISVNFGIGSYINGVAPAPNNASYQYSAPMEGWFKKSPMLDLEARWFMTDKWALKLTGGFNFGHNPGYNEVTGVTTGKDFEMGDIPTYEAVPSRDNLQFSVAIGADRYFSTKVDRLFFRVGGEFGYAYGRSTANAEDSEEYAGISAGEAYSFRVAPVIGMDYFLNEALFVGIDVRPVAYQYAVYGQRPQPGLSMLSSDNHTVTFISNPMIKFGVRF